MPLNNVNFPRHELNFMIYLNRVVSFNLFDPEAYTFVPHFTDTPPHNDNFEWLHYETSNFF